MKDKDFKELLRSIDQARDIQVDRSSHLTKAQAKRLKKAKQEVLDNWAEYLP
jgi:hypothetical protein